jgi:hypothetical protein
MLGRTNTKTRQPKAYNLVYSKGALECARPIVKAITMRKIIAVKPKANISDIRIPFGIGFLLLSAAIDLKLDHTNNAITHTIARIAKGNMPIILPNLSKSRIAHV